MYCLKCGAQLPDDAVFCSRCGASQSSQAKMTQQSGGYANPVQVLAPSTATSLKCPSCGAPIAPKFGEMIITCEYCGSSVTLGSSGWANIQKQTMLPLRIQSTDDISARVRSMMDTGLLHRHLQESSNLEEMNLSVVPYWLVAASARTSLIATDMLAEGATVATTAALFGVMAGMGGGRRGGFGGPLLTGAVLGSMMGGGIGGGGQRRAMQMDDNYNFPIVALKALTSYQPHDYQFSLQDRTLFDISQYPKGIKVLNGDISEDSARYQAKTLVDELQSQKAHAKYHMIQQIQS
ncbi:zinc-ribbon domain-containing protein [Candidatus Bathyarchaeota archaeon]|nr:MAG: zinc-ribbon domain-containing protein [Candidatus Bathyarchaeota archaeon]